MAQKKSAIVSVRNRGTVALPPSILGYSSLGKPDEYEGVKRFKLNAHLDPKMREAFISDIAEHCLSEANLAKLAEEAEKNDIKLKAPVDAAEWLGDKLKDPKEGFEINLPFIIINTKAEFKGRDGEIVKKEMGVWGKGQAGLVRCDLRALRMRRTSIIQPVVHANLFASKVAGGIPTPKLDLAGLIVVKLEQYSGQRPPEETSEEEIREILGDVDLDTDFSAYAVGAPAPGAGDGEGGQEDGPSF